MSDVLVRTDTLLARTRTLMDTRSRRLTYKAINEATRIPETWLADFVLDRHKDYGVIRVQTLHDFLLREAPAV